MALAPGNFDPDNLVLYNYTPSAPAACIFIALFSIAAIIHTFYLFRLRQSFFIPMTLGCIMEAGGYYGRFWNHNSPQNFKAYILQSLLLTPAPIFLAATIYISLSRIITALDSSPKHSLIRPTRLSKLFVTSDIFCFIVQIAGVGMQATTSYSMTKTGRKVTIIGLVIQMLIFVYFILVVVVFHRRIAGTPTMVSAHAGIHWKRHLRVMYATSGFVLVRNVFRIAEYVEGFQGPIGRSEVYIYVFDAGLMALLVWGFVVVHPGRLLRAIRRLKKNEDRAEDWRRSSWFLEVGRH